MGDVSDVDGAAPITGDGTGGLVCWGSGEFGQHSHGDTSDVPFISGAVQQFHSPEWHDQVKLVSCGSSHTVAVTNSDELYVWGNGNSGQLGCGGLVTIWRPRMIELTPVLPGGVRIVGISCGARHTVVWTDSGAVLVFGNNSYHQIGAVSNAQGSDSRGKQAEDNVVTPCLLEPFSKPVVQAACGDKHTVFLLSDGQVFCIGNNQYGQIGSGDRQPSDVPRLVDVGEQVKQVAAGANHSLALTESGAVYVWGYGKACNETPSEDVLKPEKVRVSSPVLQVAAGSFHSALITVSGKVHTWGYSETGELGHGEKTISVPSPMPLAPGAIDGRVVGVACGECITAAVTESGDLYMWGRNSHTIDPGLLSSQPVFVPVCVTKGSGLSVRHISCGAWHAAAIVGTAPATRETLTVPDVPTVCDRATSTSPQHFQGSFEVAAEEAEVSSSRWNQSSQVIPEDTESAAPVILVHTDRTISTNKTDLSSQTQSTNPIDQTVKLAETKTFTRNAKSADVSLSELKNGSAISECVDFDELKRLNSTKQPLVLKPKDPCTDLNYNKLSDINKKSVFPNAGFPPEQVSFIRPRLWRSRTQFPDPLPYTVSVSKSTATKFALPKEHTFISSKTVGFVPLEDLSDYLAAENGSPPNAGDWLQKQNSLSRSTSDRDGHFPRRKFRLSTIKRPGLWRHASTLGLEKRAPSSVSSLSTGYSATGAVKTVHKPREALTSSTTLSAVQDSDQGDQTKEVRPNGTHGTRETLTSLPSVFVKNIRRNTFRREQTQQRLKPLERQVHKVDNLKSDFLNNRNSYKNSQRKCPPINTYLFETFHSRDNSKLEEALALREQSFILYTNTQRN